MKVLYITSKPVFPAYDGGAVAVQRFLRTLLHGNIEVKHLFISTPKHPEKKGVTGHTLSDKVASEGTFIDTSVKPIPALKHLFKSGSYNVSRFHSPALEHKIVQLLEKENFTTVILDSLFTTSYLASIRKQFSGKVFLRAHNIEGDLWKTYADSASGPKKWYLNRLYKDIRTYETECFKKVDGILSISEADSQRIREMGIQTPIDLIPVTIDTCERLPDYEANTPYHLGSMDWEPNREAVDYILRILPQTRKELPDTLFHIAGSNASNYYESNVNEGIVVDGFVEDTCIYAQNKGILVSPILSGSGIRIKILEAMGLGVPVLTTTIGALGIDTTSGALIIADNETVYIKEMIGLIESSKKREEIGRNAVEYIRKNHNIENVSRRLVEVIQSK